MKNLEDIGVCVVDYGKFILLAEAFVGHSDRVFYHSPMQREFLDLNDCAKGDGIPGIERLDSFLDPAILNEIDLFVFPDIGFEAEQRYLRSIGKAVWGAMGVGDLELYRTRFLRFLEMAGLPMVKSSPRRGLTALTEYLRENENQWIKINRYRACMETWKHVNLNLSQRKLDELAVRLGSLKDKVVFVAQDEIDSEVEIGYDGWSVDGQFPNMSFQGYELKNELYLGSLLAYEDLPEAVRSINEAMAPFLAEMGYRNFLATEIRIKDETPYFIDPTFRMAGLTEDQLPLTCANLPKVIWHGANGLMVRPEFNADFVAVATLHYPNHVRGQWFDLEIPEDAKRWARFYHYCQEGDIYHFIPSFPLECDEAGVVVGKGDSIQNAIDHLKANFEPLKDAGLRADIGGFAELIDEVNAAEAQGVEFTDQPIPKPATVLEDS